MKRIFTIVLVMFLSVAALGRNRQPLKNASAGEMARFKAACDTVMMITNGDGVNEMHSLMVLKDGKKVYENYWAGHDKDELHVMWSASKSLTSIAVGFCVDAGLLSVDDKVVKFFKEDELPEVRHEYLENMTVKNLLTMASGWSKDYVLSQNRSFLADWIRPQLACGFDCAPGTKFSYNSTDTFLLSVIVSRLTGKSLADFLDEKLFKPLGIKEYICHTSPEGYGCGGWGFFMNAESLAKIGQFMLQKGEWNGRQLLSREWVEEASAPQIKIYAGHDITEQQVVDTEAKLDGATGYCYQMWQCRFGGYRFDGAFGQFNIVFPEYNAVVTVFQHNINTGDSLNNVYKYIVPLLQK